MNVIAYKAAVRKAWIIGLAVILALICGLPQKTAAASEFPTPVKGDTYTQYGSKYYRVTFGENMYDYFGKNGNKISVTVNGTAYTNGTGSSTGFSVTNDASGNAWRALIMKAGAIDAGGINTIVVSRSGYDSLTIYVNGSDGSLSEAPGAKEYTYTLSYDANGGSDAPDADSAGPTEDESHTFTITGTKPTREGYEFLGWADSADAKEAAYQPGATVTVEKPDSGTEAAKTLYAVWIKEDPVPENSKSVEYNNDGTFTLTLDITGKDKKTSETTVTPGQSGSKGTNLVLCIDISGSIVGKESALNSAIQSLVKGLPAGSELGIVLFNETASQSKIYNASTISGLTFSGVDNAGTKVATGINAATSLLNGSGWADTSKDKAIAVISDFDADDYTEAINNAKTAKNSGINIFSIKIDEKTPAETTSFTDLTTDNRDPSIKAFTCYVSSKYPSASAVNSSLFGMFNQATVTPGTADNSGKTYVFGAAGGNWSEIFAEIEGTDDQEETTETTTSTKVKKIQDTLTNDVELATGGSADVTVLLNGTKVTSGVTVTASGKNITVDFGNGIEVPDGKKLEVKIAVKPADSFTDGVKDTNTEEADVTYVYDGKDKKATYTSPQIQVRTATFKVENGSWNDKSGEDAASDIKVRLMGEKDAQLKLTSDDIPEAGEKPSAGYKAGSWDEAPAAGTVISEAKTYTYTYTAKDDITYSLKHDVNGGEGDIADVTETSKNESEKLKVSSDEPTREGYTFKGWADNADADTAVYHAGDEIEVTEDSPVKTIYAVWGINTHTVRFVDEDGSELSSKEYDHGTASGDVIVPDDPSKDSDAQYDYTFAGWDPANISDVKSDATYTATYDKTVRKYTVRWLDDDGSLLKEEQIEYGQVPDYGSAPVKDADDENTYTFDKWSPNISAVTGDAEYTASYKAETKEYTIRFLDEDGTELSSADYDYGTKASDIAQPQTPSKESTAEYDYEFDNWSHEIEDVTGNKDYVATYKATKRTYKVTFVDEDGATVLKEAAEYEYGTSADDVVRPDDPSKAEDDDNTYEFEAWEPQIATVTEDATYKATYKATPKEKEAVKTIDVPAGKTLTYNGSNQTGVPSGSGYTISGNVNKDAGTYTASVTPKDGYAWSDGTTGAKTVKYTIKKAVLTATYPGETIEWYGTPGYAVKVTGFKGKDTAKNAKGYSAPKVGKIKYSEHKSYKLKPAGGKAENYSFKYVQGVLKVKCKNILLFKAVNSGNSLKLSWTKVANADGYEVYMSYCNHGGKKYTPKLIKTVKGASNLKTTWTKLSAGKSYKGYVKAYKYVKGKKIYLATSNGTHTQVKPKGKINNATKITVNKKSLKLNKGKTGSVKAKVTTTKGKKVLYEKHCSLVNYYSSDKHIASVGKKDGKIKATGKGSCTIYAVAPNGIRASVKVTVK